MNKILLTAGVIATAILPLPLLAQPGDPGGDPGAGQPVPLGGIEILVAAAIVLGIKNLWNVQHSKKKHRRRKVVVNFQSLGNDLINLTERNQNKQIAN
jgi:hypothetical protein